MGYSPITMVVRVLSDPLPTSVLLCQDLGISEEDWQALPEHVRRGVSRLWEENRRLREQLGQTSRNSSRPPSSDPPSVPAREKKGTGRAPGGQPGHSGQTRALLPEEQVDEIVQVRPQTCRGCGHAFARAASDPRPLRHQVHELPRVAPRVTEYRIHTLRCPSCGREATGPLPAGVSYGLLGPRALATIAACTGQHHLSKRATAAFLEDVCGLQVSAATITAAERAVSAALEAPVAEARAVVRRAPEKGIDETGWSQQRDPDPVHCALEPEGVREAPPGDARGVTPRGADAPLPRAWLWVAVCDLATVFLIRRSRGSKVAKELLGEKPVGSIGSDRCSAYGWLLARWRQLCWAHLRRDFQQISERAGASGRLGSALLARTQQIFSLWHRYRDGPLTWRQFQRQMVPLQEAIGALLREGAALAEASADRQTQQTATTCRNLLRWEDSLWAFVRTPGVEPTNNRTERALRAAVLYRKVSFGTQSSQGSRYVERVLTAVATCKQHQRNVLDYLTAAVTAHHRYETAPSLLPAATRS